MEKNFINPAMMDWSDQWPNATSLSNSNPEPFTVQELQEITGESFNNLPVNSLNYQPVTGDLDLRLQMVSHWYPNCHVDDVMLTAGAQEALYIAFQALVNQGDHVVCFTPAFEPLILMPEQNGAKVTRLPLGHQWNIDLSALEQALKANAKVLVLNFPHNPTGSHISIETLNKVINLCDKYGVWILSDEVFRGLEHNPNDRLPSLADLYPRSISIGVTSKALALPGIRVGWLACRDKRLYQKMKVIKNYLSICVSGMDVTFLNKIMPHHKKLWHRSVTLINKNKNLISQAFDQNDVFNCHLGKAAATCFVVRKDAKKWAASLARTSHLKFLPGHCFATEIEGFRLCLAMKSFAHFNKIWLNHILKS